MQTEKIRIVENNRYRKYFYKNWVHNESGPAIEYSTGRKEWYQKGRLHRLDGPAVIDPIVGYLWFQRGKPHRLDGPAKIMLSTKEWFYCGKKHRLDGPAIEYYSGRLEYWLFDIKYETRFEYDVALEMYRQNNAKKYATIQENRLKKQLTAS